MTLILVNGGEEIVLNYLTNKDAPEDLVVGLFKNNVTPTDTTVIGDLTDADFSGYAEVTPGAGAWTVTPGDPTVAVCSEQDFTSDADQTLQTIYGYFIKRATSGELVWAERLPSPQDIQNNGDRVSITPRITGADTGD